MFWDSVGAALRVYVHWETYIAGLLFFVISIGPFLLMATFTGPSKDGENGLGCLPVLVLPFFQVFALLVFILTLSPIIFGVSHDAAWSFPWSLAAGNPLGTILYIGKLLLAAIILAFVPVLGRLHSFYTFLLGCLALGAVINMIKIINPNLGGNIQLWPGWWFFLGLFLIGSVLTWLSTVLAAICATLIDLKIREGSGKILVLPVSASFGFLPVFIYGAWLGSQFHV